MSNEPPTSDSASAPQGLPGAGHVFKLWFGLTEPVGPKAFMLSGFGLMIVKYLLDSAAVYQFAGIWYHPLDFLNPLLSVREQALRGAPALLLILMLLWTLPFMWVGLSMSVRRALDAGRSGSLGLLFLVPFLNYVFMVVMCFAPRHLDATQRLLKPTAPPQPIEPPLRSALLGVAAGTVIALSMMLASVYLFGEYGSVLFSGTPFLVGAVSAFIHNRNGTASYKSSFTVATLTMVIVGLAILLFALEGVICVAMALPVSIPMAIMGAGIGHRIARTRTDGRYPLSVLILMLPLLMGAEHTMKRTPEFEVVSSIEINAPPEAVWPHVIGFAELPPPDRWIFQVGIAYPRRATIKGTGVGAIRRCEFSTGAFVEPITRWEPPARLTFDVIEQPPPMHEFSPYRHVHPPHLDGYLRSTKGEFRLTALSGNRTLLEGSTWYELDIRPLDYWTHWSDAIIHHIHLRVLRHIKREVEAGKASPSPSPIYRHKPLPPTHQ